MASGHVNRIEGRHMAAPTNAAKREKSSCQLGAVHTWHLADMSGRARNVGCWSESRYGTPAEQLPLVTLNRRSLMSRNRGSAAFVKFLIMSNFDQWSADTLLHNTFMALTLQHAARDALGTILARSSAANRSITSERRK